MKFRILRPTRVDSAPAHLMPHTHELKYTALDADQRQIRLLTWDLDEDDQLACQLKVVSLKDAFEYTALSYTWSTEPPAHCIQVNGYSFWIRSTLYDFLQLTAKEPTRGRGMFIDAICISQEDMSERGSQVRLMGSVYRQASEVTVWFGLQQEFISDCVSSYGEMYPAVTDVSVVQSALLSESYTDDADTVYIEGLQYWICLHLVTQTYWGRLWTVQEYLLPKDLILRMGVLRLEGSRFYALYRRFGMNYMWRTIPQGVNSRSPFSAECLGNCVLSDEPAFTLLEGQRLRRPSQSSINAHFGSETKPQTIGGFINTLSGSFGLYLGHNSAALLVTLLTLNDEFQLKGNIIKVVAWINYSILLTNMSFLKWKAAVTMAHRIATLHAKVTFRWFERLLRLNSRITGPDNESYTAAEWNQYVSTRAKELHMVSIPSHGFKREE
ncbi:hypothetical protein LTR97_004097 [Elasticomyces elasticus]|uniref:Heterokaryon incompatibility domain-containing protein n=1 Tax=Elasticomyces elasticus TaxID=574655 RepID=A0AAN7W8V4_9PEZI|nr:hypothetical protein LTR97_004097 [Elasticomyces elasticus]